MPPKQNVAARIYAITNLSDLDMPEAEKLLLKALRDKSPAVRAAALDKHGEYILKHWMRLLEAVRDSGDKVPAAICDLSWVEASKLEMLIKSKDANCQVRKNAIKVLADQDKCQYMSVFLNALRDDSPDVRLAAIRGLDGVLDHQLVEPLKAILFDEQEDNMCRCFAVYALNKFDGLDIIKIFGSLLGDDAVGESIASLLAKSDDPRACDVLLRALDNGPPKEQLYVLEGFSFDEHNGSRLLPAICNKLYDSDPNLRLNAARALYRSMMDEDDNLATIASVALDPLIKASNDDNDEVRSVVISALAYIGDPISNPIFLKGVKDLYSGVVNSSLFALSKVQCPGAAEVLLNKLEMFKDKSFLNNISLHQDFGLIAEALSTQGDKRACDPLAKYLNSDERGIRVCAATTMLKLGDMRGLDILVSALNDHNSASIYEGWGIVNDLEDYGGTVAIDMLLEILSNFDINDISDETTFERIANLFIDRDDPKSVKPFKKWKNWKFYHHFGKGENMINEFLEKHQAI